MNENEISQSGILRLFISLTAIVLPIIFLLKGIYGSFIFTFSIPLLWQIGFLGKPIGSLGLRVNSVKSSIIPGVATGCLLGFLGGNLLKFLGITGHVFSNLHKLQFSVGSFNIVFPLQKELGYRLLTVSDTLVGTYVYLIFCVFVIGLGEELFWRGFIQKKLSNYLSMDVAIWFTAFLFALIHFYIFIILPFKLGISFLALIVVSGAAWGYLFKYFSNLWPAVISHGITAFIIWKYYFFSP